MDWEFLSDISVDVSVPIVQPFNQLICNKDKFYNCYIKINDRYIDFIDGYGLAYSDFLNQTYENRVETYRDRPVIADLTRIMKELGLNYEIMSLAIETILELYILGRLHHRQTTIVETSIIQKQVFFPVMYLLNILGSTYHVETLLTFTLAELYRKIYEQRFIGYSKEDRAKIRFYLTLMITFEPTNPLIIYQFLNQNRQNCRFTDLFGVIRDYITPTYYSDANEIIHRLIVASEDQYVITEGDYGIHFISSYHIIDRRQPSFKHASDCDTPCILFNTRNYTLPTLQRIITPQMIQDRLPLDINRKINITLEGEICSILYPIIQIYFGHTNSQYNGHDLSNLEPIEFNIYYIHEPNICLSNSLYRVNLYLTFESLNITLSSIDPFKPTDIQNAKQELLQHIINIATENNQTLINLTEMTFEQIYPESYKAVQSVLFPSSETSDPSSLPITTTPKHINFPTPKPYKTYNIKSSPKNSRYQPFTPKI